MFETLFGKSTIGQDVLNRDLAPGYQEPDAPAVFGHGRSKLDPKWRGQLCDLHAQDT
tara:strand:- start:4 stop:174 length:171 start_codon:yes stop_codon:yes gene_type:complete